MANPTNLELRQFILDTFNDEDFVIFCTDYFRDVRAKYGLGMSLEMKAMRLIPLQVQACAVPILLRAYQRISFMSDYAAGRSTLLEALKHERAPGTEGEASAGDVGSRESESPAKASTSSVEERQAHAHGSEGV